MVQTFEKFEGRPRVSLLLLTNIFFENVEKEKKMALGFLILLINLKNNNNNINRSELFIKIGLDH